MIMSLIFLVTSGNVFASSLLPIKRNHSASSAANDQNLEIFFLNNCEEIEAIAERQLFKNEVTFNRSGVKCSSVFGSPILVGHCLVSGDLDYPNSSSAFSVVFSEQVPGSDVDFVRVSVTLIASEF
jgi:hypothetical protein